MWAPDAPMAPVAASHWQGQQLEEGHGQAGAGSRAGNTQTLNGVVGERSQDLTVC